MSMSENSSNGSEGARFGRPTRFVRQQVDQPPELLGDSAGSHHGAGDVLILHDHPPIGSLAHVQIDPQAWGWRKKNRGQRVRQSAKSKRHRNVGV